LKIQFFILFPKRVAKNFNEFQRKKKLTESGECFYHSRLVVPDGLDGGEVLVQEVDPVALKKTVGTGRFPPRNLSSSSYLYLFQNHIIIIFIYHHILSLY
jgi:hypothetical protein